MFTNLSYGAITSGDYRLVPGVEHEMNNAGHVGVVVYVKGTDYRETGIIINGTPAPSPLNLTSIRGPLGIAHPTGWTGLDGLYLRTPASAFPGTPHPEGNPLMAFEAIYVENAAEYTYGGVGGTIPEPDPVDAVTCPAPPDAIAIATESPVDIQIANPRGQRVHTEGGMLTTQELDTGITSIAIPHEDGTFRLDLAAAEGRLRHPPDRHWDGPLQTEGHHLRCRRQGDGTGHRRHDRGGEGGWVCVRRGAQSRQ